MTPQEKEAKLIREELSFIGRYLDGISPKLAKYQELVERKEVLRKKLKGLPKQAGSNPDKWKKFDYRLSDVVGIVGTNRDKAGDKSGQTVRTNQFTKR